MVKCLSPLRYPGGKSKIYGKVANLILANGYGDRVYVEPFAGGFGVGVRLLLEGVVQTALLNDYDSHIYHFWYSVLNDTDNLLRLVSDTPITLEERERQKSNYQDPHVDILSDGFATLFLNRVNFSGILTSGPLGGMTQTGKYKIGCRFNKVEIIRKIEAIGQLRGKIRLHNKDAVELFKTDLATTKVPVFLNIDPPYVEKGPYLYTSFFQEEDHYALKEAIVRDLDGESPWIMTYDDCDLIRDLYSEFYMQEYGITHNVHTSRAGQELVITNLPTENFIW
ncbi:MAG: DNA adenine methylase [Candidatus Parvarchaeum sp.]